MKNQYEVGYEDGVKVTSYKTREKTPVQLITNEFYKMHRHNCPIQFSTVTDN